MPDVSRTAPRVLALALVAGAAVAIAPLWAPLVLAAWLADLLAPLVRAFQRHLRGRRRGATAIVVLLVVVALVPLALVGLEVVAGLRELGGQLTAAVEGHETVARALFGAEHPARPALREWADLVTRHPANAWKALTSVASASFHTVLFVLVFVLGLYFFAANGAASYRWLARHAPIPRRTFVRYARAFRETGRGILVGGAGTALVQGTVATIVYVAAGVPRAWLLGPLTALAALVPAIGTGLVWVPLAIELAIAGDTTRALVVAIAGAVVISPIDNLVRPFLMRYGRLRLPVFVVLVAVLGGVSAFGPWGVLLGPLLVRLGAEALGEGR